MSPMGGQGGAAWAEGAAEVGERVFDARQDRGQDLAGHEPVGSRHREKTHGV